MNGESAARLRLADDVVISGGGDAWYLTRLSSGETYALTPTGAAVASALQKGCTLMEAVGAMRDAFPDAPHAQAKRDVEDLVEECRRLGLLRKE